jgi:CRISPR-associated protein Csm5
MKLKEIHTLRLETVTPVFVGSGEVLKPLSYVRDGDLLYVVREDRLFSSLSEEEHERYLNWIEPLLRRLADLDEHISQVRRDVQRRRSLQRQRREIESGLSLQRFLTEQLRVNPLRFLEEKGCIAYGVRCRTQPGRDGFRLHLKDPSFRPYLPGTEIKGALRTSLLFTLVLEPENYAGFQAQLEKFRRFSQGGASPKEKRSRLARLAPQLEAELLRGHLRGKPKNDAKFDFLRLIHVSDSAPLAPDDLCVELTQMWGTRRYTKTWVETIATGKETHFQLSLGDAEILAKALGLERLRDWLALPSLLEAVYQRSQEILAEEEAHFAGEPAIKTHIQTLQEQNTPEAPLLRLGQGQGFLSITVGLPVKQRDPRLFDEAIREGVSFARRFRTQPRHFPKTRRVITDRNGHPRTLLGWVKLERAR